MVLSATADASMQFNIGKSNRDDASLDEDVFYNASTGMPMKQNLKR